MGSGRKIQVAELETVIPSREMIDMSLQELRRELAPGAPPKGQPMAELEC